MAPPWTIVSRVVNTAIGHEHRITPGASLENPPVSTSGEVGAFRLPRMRGEMEMQRAEKSTAEKPPHTVDTVDTVSNLADDCSAPTSTIERDDRGAIVTKAQHDGTHDPCLPTPVVSEAANAVWLLLMGAGVGGGVMWIRRRPVQSGAHTTA